MKLVECLTKGDAKVIDSMDAISAVGHRIVQGADVFDKSVLVTDEVIEKIDELRELAPVHNHAHALALRACKSVIPANVPQVVVFDTAFHQTMPPKAFMFGLPYDPLHGTAKSPQAEKRLYRSGDRCLHIHKSYQ